MQKKLLDLLVVLPQAKVMGSLDKVITDVTFDSRKVQKAVCLSVLKELMLMGINI